MKTEKLRERENKKEMQRFSYGIFAKKKISQIFHTDER